MLNNSSMLSPPSPTPSDNNRHTHQDKTALELKAMLTASMEARDRANMENTVRDIKITYFDLGLGDVRFSISRYDVPKLL